MMLFNCLHQEGRDAMQSEWRKKKKSIRHSDFWPTFRKIQFRHFGSSIKLGKVVFSLRPITHTKINLLCSFFNLQRKEIAFQSFSSESHTFKCRLYNGIHLYRLQRIKYRALNDKLSAMICNSYSTELKVADFQKWILQLLFCVPNYN
jgi:hypothetical protein